MSKNLLQDMVKIKHKRTELRKPESAPALGSVETIFKSLGPAVKSSNELNNPIPNLDNKKRNTHFALWFVAGISVLFLLFALSYFFSKAVVTLNPRVQDLVLNENLSATRETSTDALPFDLVVISGEESQTIETTEEKNVSQKAEGDILIFNTFSSTSQVLNINTKLEGSNGKIYKTQTRVVVPGMKKNGKPGSVEVKISGAEPGSQFNSSPLDFKIVNFKGGPKYAKFYGRSKGEIVGGFTGVVPFISPSQKTGIVNNMKATLKTKLLRKVTDQTPLGFVLFKDAVFLNTNENSVEFSESADKTSKIKLKGTLYGILFNEDKLTKKLAKNNVEKYDDSSILIPNIRDLIFSLSSNKENIFLEDIKNIDFTLKGSAKITWQVDTEKLMSDLLGKSKKDFNQVLNQYPNIDSANLVLSPFWRRSVPDKSKNIKLIVNYPK